MHRHVNIDHAIRRLAHKYTRLNNRIQSIAPTNEKQIAAGGDEEDKKYCVKFNDLSTANAILSMTGRTIRTSLNEDCTKLVINTLTTPPDVDKNRWGTVYTVLVSFAEQQVDHLILVIAESPDTTSKIYKVDGRKYEGVDENGEPSGNSASFIASNCVYKAAAGDISSATEYAKTLIGMGSETDQMEFDIPDTLGNSICALLYQRQA